MFATSAGVALCLASASPRRRELLASLGLQFQIARPACKEPEPCTGEMPDAYALRVVHAKAASVQLPDFMIIAADTVVSIDNRILGKPQDADDALRMLKLLNGRTHSVYTAVLISGREHTVFCEKSLVSFGNWPDEVLAAYASSGEPLDKAGAYAIQGRGSFLATELQGSFTNVVGLPLGKLVKILLEKQLITPVSRSQASIRFS